MGTFYGQSYMKTKRQIEFGASPFKVLTRIVAVAEHVPDDAVGDIFRADPGHVRLYPRYFLVREMLLLVAVMFFVVRNGRHGDGVRQAVP